MFALPNTGRPHRLLLNRTLTGWSLVSDSGVTVFTAHGPWARQKCLDFARGAGHLQVGGSR
jgi:hypothetical protein